MQTIKHYSRMLGSTALILITMYLLILATDFFEGWHQAPPLCAAGSIEARFTNCEVAQ
jgi:hypothetical protein